MALKFGTKTEFTSKNPGVKLGVPSGMWWMGSSGRHVAGNDGELLWSKNTNLSKDPWPFSIGFPGPPL